MTMRCSPKLHSKTCGGTLSAPASCTTVGQLRLPANGTHMGAIEELRKVAFWADALTEAEAARALKGITERRIPAGSYICHRGDKLDYWIGLISGLLKISAISADGKAITFAGGGAGGWI